MHSIINYAVQFFGRYHIFATRENITARVAKLVDAPSSGGGAARCAGSNPVPGTKTSRYLEVFPFQYCRNSVSFEECSLYIFYTQKNLTNITLVKQAIYPKG